MGEFGCNNFWMLECLFLFFVEWLEDIYGLMDVLKEVWNCGYIGSCVF